MKLNQLSIFLENKPGQLLDVCTLLTREKVNILTLTLADTEQFGILRLILEEWERALGVLESAGYVVNITEVLAFEVENRPGGLESLLTIFRDANMNIEYMYAFATRQADRAVLIFRFDHTDVAVEQVKKLGLNLISSVDLINKMKS